MWHEIGTYLSHHDSVGIALISAPASLLLAYVGLARILLDRDVRKDALEEKEAEKAEKKQAEEIAAKSIADGLDARNRKQAILESIPFPLISADARLMIEDWPETATAMFGYTAAEAIGKNIGFMIPDDLKAAHFAGFNHYLETGRSRIIGRAVQVYGLHKDGHTFPVSLMVSAKLNPDGTPFYTAAIMPYAPPMDEN